jgi:hypothetical protein
MAVDMSAALLAEWMARNAKLPTTRRKRRSLMTGVLPVRKPSEEPDRRGVDGDQADPSHADADASERLREAIVAARSLLVDTVDAVDPDTSAEELLRIVSDYRVRLAELVAVLPVPDSDGSV